MSACSTNFTVSDARGTLLNITETIDGQRIELIYMIHEDMVRIDYGESGSYTLFNRKTQTIYDINSNEKTVKVIKGDKLKDGKVTTPPISEGSITVIEKESQLVSTGLSTHMRFLQDNKTCLNAVVMSEFLPAVDLAMLEMSLVRAKDPRLSDIDKNSCEYVIRVFADYKISTVGMPVRMWSDNYSRFMDTYRVQVEIEKDNDWYKLPEWYGG